MRLTQFAQKLLGSLLAAVFILTGYNQAWAVVPYHLETKAQEQTAQQRLMTIIERLEQREQENIEFIKNIKMELMQLKQKDNGLNIKK